MDAKEPYVEQLVASALVQRAFMMELLAELAAGKAAPESWLREFTTRLHHRLDVHEGSSPAFGEGPAHEQSRALVDLVGQVALGALRARRR